MYDAQFSGSKDCGEPAGRQAARRHVGPSHTDADGDHSPQLTAKEQYVKHVDCVNYGLILDQGEVLVEEGEWRAAGAGGNGRHKMPPVA